VLRGGLGMLEAMTEIVSNAKVYHLGIYRDKTSLLPVEYYNKLPKRVDCDTVFVLDPCPISGATAIAAIDILKAWGASGRKAAGAKQPPRALHIKFVCIGASEEAVENISSAHPDVRPYRRGVISLFQAAEMPSYTPRMQIA
jgi:uracil phosphoribosyltransferase